MTVREFYETIGGDFDDAMGRIFDEELLQQLDRMFLSDTSFPDLTAAFDGQDWQAAFNAAHTLKGVAANLSFTRLQKSASDLTEALRKGGPAEDGEDLLAAVTKDYDETVSALKELD